MSYDDAKFGLKQTLISYIDKRNNSANEVVERIQFFKNVKLLNIRVHAIATGFTTTNTFNIYNDGDHIGEVVAVEAVTTSADLTGLTTGDLINSTSSLEIQQATAAAIGQAHVLIQYQEMFEGA